MLNRAVAWLRRKAEPRLFVIMHTLLYPGVLGSLMYALPDNIAAGRMRADLLGVASACALFAMFVMDYVYSVTEDSKANYSNGTFLADLFIVGLLFLAGQRILGTPLFAGIDPAWPLAAAKLAAAQWEQLQCDSALPTEEKRVERETDLAFGLIYAALVLVGLRFPGLASWLLVVALLGDAFYYVFYRRLFALPKGES